MSIFFFTVRLNFLVREQSMCDLSFQFKIKLTPDFYIFNLCFHYYDNYY